VSGQFAFLAYMQCSQELPCAFACWGRASVTLVPPCPGACWLPARPILGPCRPACQTVPALTLCVRARRRSGPRTCTSHASPTAARPCSARLQADAGAAAGWAAVYNRRARASRGRAQARRRGGAARALRPRAAAGARPTRAYSEQHAVPEERRGFCLGRAAARAQRAVAGGARAVDLWRAVQAWQAGPEDSACASRMTSRSARCSKRSATGVPQAGGRGP